MRLIDADVLLENIKKHCIIPEWCYVLIDMEINDAPTIDVRPVVYGEWISREIEDVMRWRECSVCGYEIPNIDWKFCPNCGADMREVQHGKV